MAALPYMPFYPSDYLADAHHLTTVEHGAYFLLIITYWARGEPLPDCDKKLSRIVKMGVSEWQEVRDEISEFFNVEDGVWSHNRIDRDLEKASSKIEQAKAAGKASAERRSNARSTTAQQASNDRGNETPTIQNQNQNHISPSGDIDRRARKVTCPDDFWPSPTEGTQTAERMAGWSDTFTAQQVEKFIAYHQHKGTTSADWNRPWTTWALNNFDERANNGRSGKPSGWLERN